MSQSDVTRRLEALEHAQRRITLQPMIDRLSATTGVSGDEIWDEATRVADFCAQHGITTSAGMIAHYAGDLGISVEQLTAETEHYRAIAV